MSYKIECLDLANSPETIDRNKDCLYSIIVITNMKTHAALITKRLPDPWHYDSEALLKELARLRALTLQIPIVTTENHSAINTVIDGIWRLEKDLRFLLHLHKEGQRSFARKAPAVVEPVQSKATTKIVKLATG